jgi:hypothetical protein
MARRLTIVNKARCSQARSARVSTNYRALDARKPAEAGE